MQIITNIIITFSIYLLVTLSFAIIYQTTKFFHFAHAAIITFASYFTFLLFKQLSLPLLLSIPISVFAATTIGLFCEIIIYKPLRNRKVTSLVLLIASLGVYIILQNMISLFWGDNTKSIRSGVVKPGNNFYGTYITDNQIIIIIVSIVLFISALLFFKYTKIGKDMRAVSSNEGLASIFGISSNKTILCAFGIGSALAAIAGVLQAFDTDITPMMGFNLLLYGIVAMILSGISSTWGLIGGAFLLATAQHFGAYYIDSKWMDAIAYIVLILFLIWKPLGFSGKRLKKIEI